MHYLLVDDDKTFSQILSRALMRRGFKTTLAHNAEDVIKLSQRNEFNRAIIDLKMEGASGLTVISHLKKQQPKIDIVMLTGYSSIATAVEAVKLGALNYLCKPANTDEILAAFENFAGDINTSVPITPPSVDRLEWEHIQKVLKENSDNISATARALGMHRRTLQRKLAKRPIKA